MLQYRPARALMTIALAIGCLLALAWDRKWLTSAQLFGWLSDRLGMAGFDWSASLVSRLAGDMLTLSMVIAMIIFALYGLGQGMGARGDRRSLVDGRGEPSAFSQLLAGRSPKLTTVLSAGADRKLFEAHFSYGRQCLMSPLRFAQWGFPVVGFIGTVIGVSDAVRQLPKAIRGGRIEESSLNGVLDGLHVAFDTTFIGLVAAVLVTLAIYVLDDMWDRNEIVAERLLANGRHSESKAQSDARTPATPAPTRP